MNANVAPCVLDVFANMLAITALIGGGAMSLLFLHHDLSDGGNGNINIAFNLVKTVNVN